MKKILITVLTLMLLSTCLVGISASEETKEDKVEHSGEGLSSTKTGVVKVNVTASPVYLINITWDSLVFDYKFDTWNTTEHKYTGASGWQDSTTRNVKLVNHSNAIVNYTAKFTNETGETTNKGVNAHLSKTSGQLISAVGTAFEEAPSDSFTVQVDGTPDSAHGESFEVDTITITLN